MKDLSFRAAVVSRGFSLVELIAVILLLGIIAGIVAPRVLGQADKGRWNATKTKISSVGAKIEAYALDMGTVPDRLDDLLKAPGNADNWAGPYAREADLKDGWGRPFEYSVPGDHGGDFDLVSLGKDGQPGGEKWAKDIGSWE